MGVAGAAAAGHPLLGAGARVPRTRLADGAARGGLPAGTLEGTNDWKRTGYGGPCPPIGRHRYFFKLYALDAPLKLRPGATKQEVEAAMKGHVLATAQLVGTYARRKR